MRNKEEIKRIDGKYYLVRELEMDGEPVPHESGMLQCVKSIDDDDCQHCCLYGMDRCGDTCSPYGFMVRVLPENSEEKIEENLSNMEETGENLKTEKEETTMKSEQALSVEEMKLKVFINKLDASCGIGTLLVAARNKA